MGESDSEIILMKCGVVAKMWLVEGWNIPYLGNANVMSAHTQHTIHPNMHFINCWITHIFTTTPHFIKLISESNSPILILHSTSSLACFYLIFSSYPATCILHLTHLICLFTLQNIISLKPLHISSKLIQNLISF